MAAVGELIAPGPGGPRGVPPPRWPARRRRTCWRSGASRPGRWRSAGRTARCDLGVLGGLVGAGVGDARGLGGEDHPGGVDEGPGRRRRRHRQGCSARGHLADRRLGSTLAGTSTVSPVRRLRRAPGRLRASTSRAPGAPPSTTPASPGVATPSTTETSAARPMPAGGSSRRRGRAASGRGLVGDGRRSRCGAGDHGGDVGPGRQLAAELLDHHDLLGQPEPAAAVGLGRRGGRATPAPPSTARWPRKRLVVGLQQHPGLAPEVVLHAGSRRPRRRGPGGPR